MNLLDLLDLYALMNKETDLFLMLQDYTLDKRLDRSVMNTVILKEFGAMRPFTNNPTVFKIMLEEFFNKWNYNIGKLLDTMYYNYNPIYTKDIYRREDEETVRDEDTSTKTTEDVTSHREDVNNTSAYDASGYQPRTQEIVDGTTNDKLEGNGTLDRRDNRGLDVHEYGNDNRFSYQELIEQERELGQFNIYEWICERMRKELFLLVY